MPHADSSFIPDTVKTKKEFWAHVHMQVQSLISVRKQWVSPRFYFDIHHKFNIDVAAFDFDGLLN